MGCREDTLQARQCYLLADQLVRLLLTDIGSLLIILIDDFDRDATLKNDTPLSRKLESRSR
jgi:hypothetical protein